MHVLRQRLDTGRPHRVDPVGPKHMQDVDHLPVAAAMALQTTADVAEHFGQIPILERSSVAQCARLAAEREKIVERIVDCPAPAEIPCMLPRLPALVPNLDPLRVDLDLHRIARRARFDRVAVVVEMNEAGRALRRGNRVEALERT